MYITNSGVHNAVHNEPTSRHPDCPDVHIGVCPTCRRLYARDESREPPIKHEAVADASEEDGHCETATKPKQVRPERSFTNAPSPSETRLDAAKRVLSSAERYARWRAKQIREDPEGFRAREAARMKKRRQTHDPPSDE